MPKSWMRKTIIILILLAGLLNGRAGAAKEQADPKEPGSFAEEKAAPPFDITEDILFFTEPYTHLEPPEEELIGMSLDLDYAEIKYEFGFVNTLDTSEPLIEFKRRVVIQDPEQTGRLREKTSIRRGDTVVVVSAGGLVHKAEVKSFSYVGNSPSTIIVAADLKIHSGKPDPSLLNSHGIAVRGGVRVQAGGSIRAAKPLKNEHPLAAELKELCAKDLPEGHIVRDARVMPAVLEPGAKPGYFVSFWTRPEHDFEIEDIKLDACMFSQADGSWTRSKMPIPLRLIQVYDLNGDGEAEIFAMTGNGMEVCYVFLTPSGNGKYTMVRKGLCAGY